MKIPTLKELKNKLPTVKLPEKLKKDLKDVGNAALFIASPPVYYGKKAFNAKANENWYEKLRSATKSALFSIGLCYVGSCTFDKVINLENIHTENKQEVAYDFGTIAYSQSHDKEVKNKSPLLRSFLPFERPFLKGTYGIKDQWTNFKGKMTRGGLEFKIEGTLPLTTNVTEITTLDLYQHTKHTTVEDTPRAVKYALGIQEVLQK